MPELKFLMEGDYHPLHKDLIYLSNLTPFLYRCTYRYALSRLRADENPIETGDLPPSAFQGEHRIGHEKHQDRQGMLGLVRDKTCEIKILSDFRGITFRVILDHFIPPNTFEEWHFKTSIKPTLTPHELSYPNAQAFFLCRVLKVPEVKYLYMVWAGDTSPRSFPDKIVSKVYSSIDFKYTIPELDKLVAYHTGKIPCGRTGGGADFCEYRRICGDRCPG